MGITVQPTDPQFTFGLGSPYQGVIIGATLQDEPILGGSVLSLSKLTPEGYNTEEWLTVGMPDQGNIVTDAEIAAAGGELAYVLSRAASIYANAVTTFPADPAAGVNWIHQYSPPPPFNFDGAMLAFLGLYNSLGKPAPGTPNYVALIPLRDLVIASADDLSIQLIERDVYTSCVGMNRAQLLAKLQAWDNGQ